jgi:phosphoglycolate phosphatase-like HAD superfamily hydrolase
MVKKYLIFDMDWTLIESMENSMKIVLKYLKTIEWIDMQKAEYIFKTTLWMALKSQLILIFDWSLKIDIDNITDKIFLLLEKNNDDFFPWVINEINNLSKQYKLFLTTWNSTKTAIKYLKKWKILNKFELVYWSDKIFKWHRHLNIFKDYSNDEKFFQNSIYIWDWAADRLFAKEAWIDFIHIWNDWIDKYEIEFTKDIAKILQNFN